MKLGTLYKKAVKIGIDNDLRAKKEINRILKDEKTKFEKLDKQEKEFFDKERLSNPFSDTRILAGDPNTEVKTAIVGIDMQVGEVLLTHLLNKERRKKIDLIISHHPEGIALARLYDVMKLQSDLLAQFGITISVAEQLMEKRIGEIERRLTPVNHTRSVDASKLLKLPMMCIHTPADNCVTNYLNKTFHKEKPFKLGDVISILNNNPEYRNSAKSQVPPKIVSGTENNRCGKIYVDMTGGTSGSKDIYDKYVQGGVSTLVCMYISEEHLDKAKNANLNVIIGGHIASDNLGLNLLFDEIEKDEKLNFVAVSGFERIRRLKKD